MNVFTYYKEFLKRKKQIDKITIYPNGSFELKSKHLFSNKQETLNYIEKLRNAVQSYNSRKS